MSGGAALPESMPPRSLLLGAAAVFCLLALGSAFLDGPQIHADEGSYLLNAAALAGVLRESLVWGYWSGYSLLLTPAFLLWSQPGPLYHAVLLINALLIASVPFALYFLTRRLWPDLPTRAHVIAALAATCYAPLLLLGQYAMAENALVPLHAWLLAACAMLLRRPRIATALAAGCLAGLLALVHPRGAAMAFPVIAVVSLAGLRESKLRWPLAAMWILAVGVAALHVPLESLADRADKVSRGSSLKTVLGHFAIGGSWKWIGLNLVGSATEAIVGSIGLLVLALRAGAADLRHMVVGDRKRDWPRMAPQAAAFTAFAIALLVTAVFFVPPTRADQLAYGRYVLPTLVPLLAFGVLRMFRCPECRGRDAAWAIIAGAAGILVMGVAFLDLPRAFASRWNFINAIGLFLANRFGPFDDVWVSVLACFVVAMVLVHFLAGRSIARAVAMIVAINLAIFCVAWRIVTWPDTFNRNAERTVIEAARAFEPATGVPLCIQLDPRAVKTWHRVDLGWRLLPQLSTHVPRASSCVPAMIRPVRDAPATGMRLVAAERPSPVGGQPIGLFVASGAELAAFGRSWPLPPGDAIAPIPVQDRRSEVDILSASSPELRVGTGAPVYLDIRVVNRGSTAWSRTTQAFLPYPVNIGAIASDGVHPTTNYRNVLPRDIGPGETDIMTLKVGPFRHAGRYKLHVGVVQEHVAWFDGGETLQILVTD